ncbi:MAG: right-handed parallel beta-helix repeat-containing protein, partial [Planctomycetota bacterium JB042]
MRVPNLTGLRPLLAAALVWAGASSASALTLSGALSDSTTGPVPAGVHHVVGSLTVPAGQTLTIQPGAILKFNNGLHLSVQGTLLAPGTAGQPIVFTTITDDVGGDTNGDGGATTPAAGNWQGIRFEGTATGCVLDHCDVAYHGWGGWCGIYLNGDGLQLALTNSTVRDGSDNGIEANQRIADLTVSNCAFTGNAKDAVAELRVEHCPGFTNNTAGGNGVNAMVVTQPDPTANVTIEKQNCLGGALVFTTNCDVPAGVTLTLKEGVVVKLNIGSAIDVDGTLNLLGTALDPTVVTGYADDVYGGDTNNDGPSNGAPGNTRGIVLAAGAIANLDHAVVRYGGWGGWPNLYVGGDGVQLTMTDSAIEHSSDHGIEANTHVASLKVS